MKEIGLEEDRNVKGKLDTRNNSGEESVGDGESK